jgi:translocator protein
MGNRWLVLTGFLALCLGTGALGGWVTAQSVADWYPTLNTPSFNPPAWIFGPVWTLLYSMMAVAAWLVWQTGERRAHLVFFLQLALNFLWSFLFFGLKSPGLAVIDIALLWAAIGVTLIMFFTKSRIAGWLMVPYFAWVSFASILNAAIWWLN